jgi:hypothetical protein
MQQIFVVIHEQDAVFFQLAARLRPEIKFLFGSHSYSIAYGEIDDACNFAPGMALIEDIFEICQSLVL